MRKLVSPMTGKIMQIKVKAGQVISRDDEVLTIESIDNEGFKEKDEYEEFPRYQMLYEYFTCSYFSAI